MKGVILQQEQNGFLIVKEMPKVHTAAWSTQHMESIHYSRPQMANRLPDTGLTNLGKFKTDILAGIHLLHLLLTTHNNVACKDNFIKQLLFSDKQKCAVQRSLLLFPILFRLEESEDL